LVIVIASKNVYEVLCLSQHRSPRAVVAKKSVVQLKVSLALQLKNLSREYIPDRSGRVKYNHYFSGIYSAKGGV